jgi:opacity protein-like surface antigen
MNRHFLTTASVFALTLLALPLLALPALAQSYTANIDPYGYGAAQAPLPLPGYQAQQMGGNVYAPVAQYAAQQTVQQYAPQQVVQQYVPQTVAAYQVAAPASYQVAAPVGYIVQADNAAQQAVGGARLATQAYGVQSNVPTSLPPVAATVSTYAQPAYQQQASSYAVPAYDSVPSYPTQAAQPVTQQLPQVQTYSYAAPQQQAYTQPAYTQQTYTQPAYTTAQVETPRAQISADPVAMATEPGNSPWYWSLRTGVTLPKDTDFTRSGLSWTDKYKNGWEFGAAMGYAFRGWNSWIAPRLELEMTYDQQSIDANKVAGVTTKDPDAFGNVRSLNLLANGYLDFRLNRMLTPYIGAGVGPGYSDFDRIGNSATGTVLDDNDVGLVWQAMGGLGFRLSPRDTIDIGYRFQQNTGLNLKTRNGTTSTTTNDKHVLMVGFRESF